MSFIVPCAIAAPAGKAPTTQASALPFCSGSEAGGASPRGQRLAAGNMPGKLNENGFAQCWCFCGVNDEVVREGQLLVNGANSAAPRHVCRACRNCAVAIYRSLTKEGKEAMKNFNAFKANHTNERKKKVRATRLLHVEARRKAVAEMTTTLSQTVRLQQGNNILWLTKTSQLH